MKDKPFHVVGHRVEGQPDKTYFDIYVNNRPMFRKAVKMSRREAKATCDSLNASPSCCKWANEKFPMKVKT